MLVILALVAAFGAPGFRATAEGGRDRTALAAVERAVAAAAGEAARFPDAVVTLAGSGGALTVVRDGSAVDVLSAALPAGYLVAPFGPLRVGADGFLAAATTVTLTAPDASTYAYRLDRSGTLRLP